MNVRPGEGEAVLQATALAPFAALRLAASYLRMKRQAKRARRVFYHELVAKGMAPHHAGRLADEYASAISMRTMIRTVARRS